MNFEDLGLRPRLVEGLAAAGITKPTPIQEQAIPHAMEGRDVLGLAQTGTGKTAAFGLPMINLLIGIGEKPAPKTVSGLILAATRELANQIAANATYFCQKPARHWKSNCPKCNGKTCDGPIRLRGRMLCRGFGKCWKR